SVSDTVKSITTFEYKFYMISYIHIIKHSPRIEWIAMPVIMIAKLTNQKLNKLFIRSDVVLLIYGKYYQMLFLVKLLGVCTILVKNCF
ncbi:hypothetical protein, partial [Polaribacter sp. BAL334]|uniref:hypothetical protein n=1 Tax=Polaribacter sp. BAL334 TaxID=1708178 RepID=UPI001E5AC111